MYVDGFLPQFINNTISENSMYYVSSLGGGIYVDWGTCQGYNNIVYGNSAVSGPDCYGNVSFTYSCSGDLLSGTGNITDNPMFVDPSRGDFNLQAGSPCIDAGDPGSPLDPDSTIADMGAFYYDQSSAPDMIVEIDYVSGSPVPSGGGTLYYSIWGENQGPVPLDYDIWIDKIYESTDTTTLILREITNYLPGWQINRPDAWFPVPSNWPGGNYEFRIYSGWHPEYDVWHTDAFPWVKSGPVDLGYDFEVNLPPNAPDLFEDIGMTQVDYAMPTQFEVMGAYPNPFNPATTLSFSLPQAAVVSLKVYDVSGREVAALVNGYRNAGTHEVTFDASHLTSCIYIYQIQAGDFSASGKMVLVK